LLFRPLPLTALIGRRWPTSAAKAEVGQKAGVEVKVRIIGHGHRIGSGSGIDPETGTDTTN
jgi:hypothetical protein